MAIEIERKFLIDYKKLPELKDGQKIIQAYICNQVNKSVRIRVRAQRAFITIKSGSNPISRAEYEYQIPLQDALEMLDICDDSIEKTRYIITIDGLDWEIDVFHNKNEGLIVAEVELQHINQKIKLPAWIKQEVSNDKRYLNACLIKNPFTNW